ncbi:MAG: bifunctional phosphoglucose/phosphomannose isomerase [Candidatus Ranarchaeia archaeon]
MESNLTPDKIKILDPERVLDSLIRYPENLDKALMLARKCEIPKTEHTGGGQASSFSPRGIVVTGMGGSGIAGAYLREIGASRLRVPVILVNSGQLPVFVNKDWLVLCISYSGNTQETLDTFRQAISTKARIVIVASGGLLIQEAKRHALPFVKIPTGLTPRMAFPLLVVVTIFLLEKFGFQLIENEDFKEAKLHLEEQRQRYLDNLFKESEIRRFAIKLIDRFAVIYGAGPMSAVAYRFKCQLNENAKTPAWSAQNPEICHNEIVGWEHPPSIPVTIVSFRDPDDLQHVKIRSELIEEYLQRKDIPVITIHGVGKSIFSRVMTATYTGDWISYYLALLRGVNPASTDTINWLKSELRKRLA